MGVTHRSSPALPDANRNSPAGTDTNGNSPAGTGEIRNSPTETNENRSSPAGTYENRNSPVGSEDNQNSPTETRTGILQRGLTRTGILQGGLVRTGIFHQGLAITTKYTENKVNGSTYKPVTFRLRKSAGHYRVTFGTVCCTGGQVLNKNTDTCGPNKVPFQCRCIACPTRKTRPQYSSQGQFQTLPK